jgi:predicted N-formylglutamate amidohydrolase
MSVPLRSVEGVCAVEHLCGAGADANAPPDLLLEVAHGATRTAHFDALRAELRGDYPADLADFFHVNTDVGSYELARATAVRVLANQPRRSALLVRCLLPRTFVDCNRRVDRDAVAAASKPGEMTPGLQPWVQDPRDRQLLLDRYFAYRDTVTRAFELVAGRGGMTLFVHTYAPRSIDVAVDADIGRNLRAAYAPEKLGSWRLRPAVDLITHDPDGVELAHAQLAQRAAAEFAGAGFEVARNATYALHPVTLAHEFARREPRSTLCLEVRRDLLVPAFVPFVELDVDPHKVDRAAQPLAAAVSMTMAAK